MAKTLTCEHLVGVLLMLLFATAAGCSVNALVGACRVLSFVFRVVAAGRALGLVRS